MAAASSKEAIDVKNSPLTLLLGASPFERPDLAKAASPITYVDKNDPPFIIIQGEKDESVPYTQSVVLSSWLKVSGVHQELIIVPNAPHYGEMFDTEPIRKQLFNFLYEKLKR
jgi:dipeptidyl aminopeptidase/acylaminoacyl peptidase